MSIERNTLFDQYLTRHFAHVSDQKRFRGRKIAYYRHNYTRYVPLRRDASILDIGPGYGEWLELLHRSGFTNLHAVDLSSEVAAFCNTVVPQSTEAIDDTAAYLHERAGHFDMITMFHILEHVPKAEIIPLMRAACAALKPGGRLIVEVPNMANPVIGMNVRYADFTHEVGFTELSLRYVLETTGFQRVNVFGTTLSRDHWARPAQRLAQFVFTTAIWAVYRAYGQSAPHILGRSVSATATR